MSQTFSFNLVEEAWLHCLQPNGRTRLFSLRQTLLQAHELRELSGSSPLERLALHRLLLAVLHRLFGPADYDAWENLWQAGRFPAAPVKDYLAQWRHRFDLFDAERPFYQAADDRVKTKSVISLIPEMAAGNNPTFFDHHTEERGVSLATHRAARALVTAQAFGIAGPCDPSQKLYFTDGPCTRGILFLVAGDNLFQTLLLNMIQYPADEPVAHTEADKPAWEMDDPFTPKREMPLGYLDYLTWQNRRVMLKPEGSSAGTVVRSMTMSPGLRLDSDLRDPMKHYRRDTRRGFRHLQFDEERALWRDSAALLTLHKSEEDFSPLTFRWLRELVDQGVLDRRHIYRCLALGMSSYQARIYFFRSERLPFPLAYLDRPQLVQRLRDATDAAEQTSHQLWGATRTLAKFVLAPLVDTEEGRDPANEDQSSLVDHWAPDRFFWAALDQPFQSLAVDLPREPEAALARWYKTLQRTAWDALEHTIRQTGDDGRALKAAVQARRQLGAGLRKIPVFRQRQEAA